MSFYRNHVYPHIVTALGNPEPISMASHPICPSAAGSSAPNLSSSGLLKAATSRATFPDSSGKPVSASSAWTPATYHASPNVAATASGARPFPSPDPNAMHSGQHPNRDAEPADHGACLFRPAPAQSTPCSGSEPNRPAPCAHARKTNTLVRHAANASGSTLRVR